MYDDFKYENVPLSKIRLDVRNPRIITPTPLSSEEDIISYLFEHEDLAPFLRTIATEGRNPGAERPYLIEDGQGYVVIEGNTRIAAYKLLSGMIKAPLRFSTAVPRITEPERKSLLKIDVTISPSRDALMTIMARAHFGRGEKSRWSYLGSRKAVFDDWKNGKTIQSLSDIFGKTQSQIRDYILEYKLYLETLALDWTDSERDTLLRPSLEFNPPVRFLQTTGHKQKVGIDLDKVNLRVIFTSVDGKSKLKHLVKRTVIEEKGPSSTSSYDVVFYNYEIDTGNPSKINGDNSARENKPSVNPPADNPPAENPPAENPPVSNDEPDKAEDKKPAEKSNTNTLFSYTCTKSDLTLRQLMREASSLNIKRFPGAGTAILRCIVEVVVKIIIEEKSLNRDNKLIDAENSINLLISSKTLSPDDARILKEFKKNHLEYLNLTVHATVVPNDNKLKMARDTIDSFIRRNI